MRFFLVILNTMKMLTSTLISLLLIILAPLLCPDISPSAEMTYVIPLGNERARDYNKLKNRVIGKYGDNRNSNVRGHKHAGIDMKGNFSETVYSIGKGVVINVFRDFPHKTIYIRHHDKTNASFYSVYIHVEDIQVNVGDSVTKRTAIGRIFNREELRASNFGTSPHLHFEIRHSIKDKGDATFKSMSIPELDRYCIDPEIFFKETALAFSGEWHRHGMDE